MFTTLSLIHPSELETTYCTGEHATIRKISADDYRYAILGNIQVPEVMYDGTVEVSLIINGDKYYRIVYVYDINTHQHQIQYMTELYRYNTVTLVAGHRYLICDNSHIIDSFDDQENDALENCFTDEEEKDGWDY